MVFATNGKARNNVSKWSVQKVMVHPDVRGFDFYATKDLEMANRAHDGFMIWNGKSRGTFNNILDLIKLNKKVLIYMTADKQFYTISYMHEAEQLKDGTMNKEQYLKDDIGHNMEQLSLFS